MAHLGRGVRLLVCAAVLQWLPAGAAHAEGTAGAGKWSRPATLSDCPGAGRPQVVFPSDKPTRGTGPGAIVWSASPPCPGGAGVRVAAIGPEDVPGPPTEPRTAAGAAIVLRGPVAATAGPYGRIVIAAASAAPPTIPAAGLLLTEGPAGGPFAAPIAAGLAASPFALTTAYLGDVALVSMGGARRGGLAHRRGNARRGELARPRGKAGRAGSVQRVLAAQRRGEAEPTGGLRLRVQRHHANRFAAPVQVSAGWGAPIEALAVALDFRSDALVVWARRGSVYARELPATGAPHRVERLGAVGRGPASGARIAAVLSDDDRAIVAWSDRRGGRTSVYVSRSQAGVRFGSPRLLESFSDPSDLPSYKDSPQIVRLSSESVMMAWTGAENGHWVVRTAAIDLNGVSVPSTISPPGSDALLAALAPGPDDEALALWTEPQPTPTGPNLGWQAIFAARGIDASPARTIFAAGEQVAPPGPNSDATVAVDPDSDRAVVAWRTGACAVDYSLHAIGGA